jgi:thymidylate synthase
MNSYFEEKGYLELLKDTINNSEKKQTRNGIVYSRFGTMITFSNLNNYFPLLTTKKMFIKGIIEELLWFLKGSTNAKELQNKNIHIWDLNSSREYLDSIGLNHYEEGELGPIYGWQWRNFGKSYNNNNNNNNGFDQIKYIIEELMKPDNSRRAVLSAWNPVQLKQMALPPCHITYTFYKDSKGLSCLMNMRSSDLFLGLPFNIASTALLTRIIAEILHIRTNTISIVSTDAHIYIDHIDAVHEQIQNPILTLPKLEIKKQAPSIEQSIEEKIEWINNLKYDDFNIFEYESANSIKATIK